MTPRYAPLAPMSPFEDRMGADMSKTKTLLLENYKNMLSNMHQNTAEKARIEKMIAELTESLFNTDVFIEGTGPDLNTIIVSLAILATSLADMGGDIYQMQLKGRKNEISPDLSTEKMKISLGNTNKLLG